MTTIDDFQQRLTEFIASRSGQSVQIQQVNPLAGGASRDMWLLHATLDDEPQQWVLRRDLATSMNEQALTRAQEFHLMQIAHERGVRVARPRWLCEESSVLGSPFFIMDFVEGVGIGRKVVQMPELAHARTALPGQMAGQLALIHTLETDKLDFLPRPRPGFSPAQEAITQTYAMIDSLKITNPAFEFALRWAEQHAPASERVTFVHGDFRLGNLVVNAEGLAAIADWEFAHIGDPLEEIGYTCMRDWRFGFGHLRLGGIADREPFLLAYEQASGCTIDRRAVDFWEFIGNLRWGVICLSQANRHLSGQDPSVEFASLGRRSAEMQLEMLNLIDQIGL